MVFDYSILDRTRFQIKTPSEHDNADADVNPQSIISSLTRHLPPWINIVTTEPYYLYPKDILEFKEYKYYLEILGEDAITIIKTLNYKTEISHCGAATLNYIDEENRREYTIGALFVQKFLRPEFPIGSEACIRIILVNQGIQLSERIFDPVLEFGLGKQGTTLKVNILPEFISHK